MHTSLQSIEDTNIRWELHRNPHLIHFHSQSNFPLHPHAGIWGWGGMYYKLSYYYGYGTVEEFVSNSELD